ncbi:MAG: RpiB/LacA/LacB family sugar-phosphate isomerase [Patescibacteria group bacterium]
MKVYFGADHRGFNLKEILKKQLEENFEVVDLGNKVYDEGDDYPDFAAQVAARVSADPLNSKGVVICGSGAGVDVVANKFAGVRSVLGISPEQVKAARSDDDVNVLSIAANFTKDEEASAMLKVFLETQFSGEERYKRRIEKISEIEKGQN